MEALGEVRGEALGILAENRHETTPEDRRRNVGQLIVGRCAARPRRRPRHVDLLADDRAVQLLERRAGLDAELGQERAPRVLVRLRRVALPPRPVEREDQLPPQTLAQRVRGNERLQLGHERVVVAELELGVDQVLACDQTQLFEPVRLGRGERLVGDIEERRAAP